MSQPNYRTKPDNSTSMPGGIPYIVGNEAAERFSFYGMRGILTIFMTQHLCNAAGQPDVMGQEEAKSVYHLFVGSAYFFPIIGSLLSDILWGKYRTILILSLGYCIGHLLLALGDTGLGAGVLEPRNWLYLGLIFVAIGSGGIKPCVSAHVGDQFGKGNQQLLSRTFGWFYFSINVGAAASNLLTPYLLDHPDFGPAYAFGLPGILMALATFMFWMGRNKFIHIPAAGWKRFSEETLNREGIRALTNLSPLFLIFVPMFWACFDQTGSAWVLQATRLDREFLGITWYEAQVQAVNPVLILVLIPTFSYLVYPLLARFFEPTPLRKIGIGLFTMVVAFGFSGWIESQLTGGDVQKVSSQLDRNQWRGIHLIDGDSNTGWLALLNSDQEDRIVEADGEGNPLAGVVLRLRENKAWKIDRIKIHPLSFQSKKLPEKLRSMSTQEAQESCSPDKIQVAVASTPGEDAPWRTVATIEVGDSGEPVEADFEAVEANFVRLRLDKENPGPCLGLNEVEVMAAGAAPDKAPSSWPNVVSVGDQPSIGWQFLAYLILTASEVMVSIVCLEFAYTQAPRAMKSVIMGVYFLGVSFGNFATAAVNHFIANKDGTSALPGASYYWFFSALMLIMSLGFVVWSQFYKGQTYIQGEEDEAEALAEGVSE